MRMGSLRGALLGCGASAPPGPLAAFLANLPRSFGASGGDSGAMFGARRRVGNNHAKQLSLYHSSSSSLWDRLGPSVSSQTRSLHTKTACLLSLTSRHCWSLSNDRNLQARFNRHHHPDYSNHRINPILHVSSSASNQLTLGWRPHPPHRPFSSSQVSQPNYPEESSDSEISSAKSSSELGVEVVYFRGLPQLTIPLPSRRERCRFVVKPLTNTVGDLLNMIRHEDKGVDRVAFHSSDGIRIASANTIEMLMERDFEILINDSVYKVVTPPQEKPSEEDLERLSSVRNLVGQLYGALNIDEHQLRKEREMLTELEKLQNEVHPMEDKREQINQLAIKRTNVMTWVGLGMMSVQFGILARLTWWEYSWDIMEPVTYFVTYGTAMLAYAYFVLTKQEYILPAVADRQYLLTFHKNAKKVGLDVDKYNRLKDQIHKIEGDLRRLRDPLALHLPLKTRLVSRAELAEMEAADGENAQGIVAKASQRIQQMFTKKSS